MLKNNNINRGIYNTLLKMNLHKNIHDLYATCVIANTLLSVKDLKLCRGMKEELLGRTVYDRGQYDLFKTVLIQHDDFDKRLEVCNSITIHPLYLPKLMNAMVHEKETLHIARKEKEVRLIRLNGEIYDTLRECVEETGMTEYQVRKEVVKEVLIGLMYKSSYKETFLRGNIPARCDYRDDIIKKFYEDNLENIDIWLKMYEIDSFGNMLIYQHGIGIADKNIAYSVVDSGRLFLKDAPNFQGMKSMFRDLFFDGYYEIDISTCAPTTLLQMSDYKYEFIEDYIEDKNKYRGALVEHGFTMSQAKELLTSLFFGAKPLQCGSGFRKDNPDLDIDRIVDDPLVFGLMEDTINLFKELGDRFKNQAVRNKSKWELKNAAGYTKRFDKWNRSKAVAHMYQGVERLMLDVLRENTDSVLLLHDAVVCKTFPNLEDIIRKIKAKTGYNVTLSFRKYDKENFYKGLE